MTAETLFRGAATGDDVGPFVSQFLVRDIPFGAYRLKQKLVFGYKPDSNGERDFLINEETWLTAQRGIASGAECRGGRHAQVHLPGAGPGQLRAHRRAVPGLPERRPDPGDRPGSRRAGGPSRRGEPLRRVRVDHARRDDQRPGLDPAGLRHARASRTSRRWSPRWRPAP